jgi:hypothetical protein
MEGGGLAIGMLGIGDWPEGGRRIRHVFVFGEAFFEILEKRTQGLTAFGREGGRRASISRLAGSWRDSLIVRA